MKSITLQLKNNCCEILIGYDMLSDLGKRLKRIGIGMDAVVITNPGIQRLYGEKLSAALEKFDITVKFFTVPDGERSKSAPTAFELLNRIARYDVRRKIFILAFGGGVIGDLTGFVASCYKRGVPYIQVPTTLLAQIDSAIGGKVGIDLSQGKNLVGAFYHPKFIFSDVKFLESLSLRQIRNGLSEAIKYGMIYDRLFFESMEKSQNRILALEAQSLFKVVQTCSRIKSEVVARDERETKGIRTILNFGHTVGHAIESVAGYYKYQHGEAIAIGMRVAADISVKMGFLRDENAGRLKNLISTVGLPTTLKGMKVNKILEKMAHDKKFVGKKNRFVLVSDIGKVLVVDDVPYEIIEDCIRNCIQP